MILILIFDFFELINTWNGDVPSKLTILMVPSENYHGTYITDPFAFKHNYVKSADEYFSRSIEYFDSLRKEPLDRFIKFMQTKNKKIIYNTKRLQSNISLACGYFCLYFYFF